MILAKKILVYGCALALTAALLLAAGCSNPNGAETFVPVTDIAGVPAGGFAGTPVSLADAAAVPADAANQTIVWTLKDAGTTGISAGMLQTGSFTATAPGTVILTATIADGVAQGAPFAKDFEIVIAAQDSFVAVTDIAGLPDSGVVGSPVNLNTATVVPADASNQTIVWTLKDAGTTGITAAMVQAGSFTATAPGTATLTATVADGSAIGTPFVKDFTIEIIAQDSFVAVTDITGAPTTGSVGSPVTLDDVTVEPTDAANKTIVWTVKDAGATGLTDDDLTGGVFTPQSAGRATLTATIAGGAAPGEPFVKDFAIEITAQNSFVPVTDIAGAPTTGYAGSPVNLNNVTVVPAGATNKTIVWTVKDAGSTGLTSDDLVGGVFTPNSAGTATLTATIAGGAARDEPFAKDFAIEIAAQDAFVPVTGIAGLPDSGTAGTRVDLNSRATVQPPDATNRMIAWTVKDAGATGLTTAAVAGGVFTPAKAGTATLVATIADGTGPGSPFVREFTMVISEPNVFVPVQFIADAPDSGLTGTEVDLSAATAYPSNATNKAPIAWTVKIAGAGLTAGDSINGGKFTPASPGKVTVTAVIANGLEDADYAQDFEITISDPDVFVPVERIDGVPETGVAGSLISLAGAKAVPSNANHQTIVWSGKDAGGTAVTTAMVRAGPFTPPNAGTLVLQGMILSGAAANTPFIEEYTIEIAPAFIPVTGIEGIPATRNGVVGIQLDLTAGVTVLPYNATNQDIVWSVKPGAAGATGLTDAAVASGVFTPASPGTATLIAAIVNGKAPGEDFTAECVATIIKPVTGFAGVPTAGYAGSPVALNNVTVVPADATSRTIVWTLKDAGTTGVTAAMVQAGSFTATAPGTVTLTATVADGSAPGTPFAKDFAVEITKQDIFVPVTGIAGLPDSGTAGTPVNLNSGAAVEPPDATNRTIAWTVKDAGSTGLTTAAVAGGVFTPAKAGTAVLVAAIADGTNPGSPFVREFDLVISEPNVFVPVQFIADAPDSGLTGTEVDLSVAAAYPSNATNKAPIVWTVKTAGAGLTAGDSISGGKFTPASAGKVTVTATIANGLEDADYAQDFEITISDPAVFVPVERIDDVPETGIAGSLVSLAGAKAVPSNASYRTIVWSVKDPGGTAVTTAMVRAGPFTPPNPGTLVLQGMILSGAAVNTPFIEEYTIAIASAFVPATGIEGVADTRSAVTGIQLDLTAGVTVLPYNATNQDIVWSVKPGAAGDTGLTDAAVASGVFTPASPGTATLIAAIANGTAPGEDFTKECVVTVIKPVTGIAGVPASGTRGYPASLAGASAVPADATNRTIVWTVKDAGGTGVTDAMVQTGAFTPTGAGTLTLTAAIANGSAPGVAWTKDFIISVNEPGTANPDIGLGEDSSIPLLGSDGTTLSKAAPVPVAADSVYYVSLPSGYIDVVWYLNSTKQTVTGGLIYLDTATARTIKLLVEGWKDGLFESSGTYTFVIQ
jgi:hypothetical protein